MWNFSWMFGGFMVSMRPGNATSSPGILGSRANSSLDAHRRSNGAAKGNGFTVARFRKGELFRLELTGLAGRLAD